MPFFLASDSESTWRQTAAEAVSAALLLQAGDAGNRPYSHAIGIAPEEAEARLLAAKASPGEILASRRVVQDVEVAKIPALSWTRRRRWKAEVREDTDLDSGQRKAFARNVPWECEYSQALPLLNRPFDTYFRQEMDAWVSKRNGRGELAGKAPAVANQLFGVALSGGGQRAGIFSLGVCQGLARHGLLDRADYLSSVSGGGYFNASLQAMAAEPVPYIDVPERDGERRFGSSRDSFPFAFPRDPEPGPPPELPIHGLESPALWHVRKHARLLGNRIGLLDPETWDTFFRWLGGLLLAWLIFLLPGPAIAGAAGAALFSQTDVRDAFTTEHTVCTYYPRLALEPDGSVEQRPRYVQCREEQGVDWGRILGPAFLWLGAAAILGRLIVRKRDAGEKYNKRIGLGLAIAGLVPIVWLLAFTVIGGVWLLEDSSTGGTLYKSLFGALGGISAAATSLGILGSTRASSAESEGSVLRRLLLIIGGYVLLYVLFVLLCWGIWRVEQWQGWPGLAVLVAAALGAVIFTSTWRNARAARFLNWLSIHTVYHDRIRMAWVISGNERGKPDAKPPLTRWARVWRRDIAVTALSTETPTTPYPLFCATVNIPGSRGEKSPERKGDSFVIAPVVSGSASTRWFATAEEKRGYSKMQVATAATVSGAAFSPNMGEKTTRTLSIMLTVFNARIGRWCPNPRSANRKDRTALKLYYKELFANPARDDHQLYLSDGGHFENQGLYELIRRRCKYVVAISADIEKLGMDDRHGNLATAIRLVREDFGVEIEMGAISAITRGQEGDMASAYSMGLIRYPLGNDATDDQRKANTGVLVVIKSGIVTGDLTVDLLNHWRSHPDFPYTPTENQQFDQAQFESYRQLGYLAGAAVGRAAKVPHGPDTLDRTFRQLARTFALASNTPRIDWS